MPVKENSLRNLTSARKGEIRNLRYQNGIAANDTSSLKYNKDKFKNLLLKYGSNRNVHNEIKELLINEFKNCTVLPGVKNELQQIPKLYGFTINIECKTVQVINPAR